MLEKKNGLITLREKHITKEYGKRGNIWKYAVGYNNSYKEDYLKEHPAIFPLQLAIDHIITWSNEEDMIYDPFSGSGTVAVAAKILKRNSIASEISKKYYDLSIRRISEILI